MKKDVGNHQYGICLADGKWYAVYKAAESMDAQSDELRGGLYSNGNLIIELEVPVNIINNQGDDHVSFSVDSIITGIDIDNAICEVFWELTSEQSLRVLELLNSVWSGRMEDIAKDKECESRNWYTMLGILIYNIQKDRKLVETFADKYEGMLVSENDWSIYSVEERKNVLEWYNGSDFSKLMRIVCYPFSKFGFPTMYELWKQYS